jgi:CRP-like cAMP-binding protein
MPDEMAYLPSAPERNPAQPRLTTLGKAELIRALELFSQASVEQLYRLASIAQEADFAAGQTIFQEEDIGDAFYVLVKGKVEHTSEQRNIKEVLGPGEALGLYSVLTREPRYATARALEDTFAISIGAEDLYNLLSNNMEIVVSIFKYFIKKLGMGPKE